MTNRRLWGPGLVALAGAVLALTVTWPLVAGRSADAVASEPRVVTRTMTIPAAAFHSGDDEYQFHNNGGYIDVESGDGSFFAPLFFPVPQVKVTKLVLFALDDNGGSDLYVKLWKTTPANGGESEMGKVSSSGAGSATRWFTQTTFNSQIINSTLYGSFLHLYIPSSSNLTFYGVRITYTYTA